MYLDMLTWGESERGKTLLSMTVVLLAHESLEGMRWDHAT